MEKFARKQEEKLYSGMKKVSREEILSLVHNRDKKNFKFPKNFENIDWNNIPFLTWFHPSGHKAYLLETESGNPRLWTLENDLKSTHSGKASMCSLCYYVGSSGEIKMFTFIPESNKNKTIGVHLCSDLNCAQNVTKIGVNSMRETITKKEKIERMMKNLHEILLRFEIG